MDFFDINNTFFTALGYTMSYLEFFGTIAGALAVWLSARGNIWGWPIGIINIVLFFFLFYQVQLYPDMFLQVFFFITNLIGWWRWAHPNSLEQNVRRELKVSFMPVWSLILLLAIGLIGTLIVGSFADNLHIHFPRLFNQPSAFPYADSFVTVMSVVATYLMVQKKAECWIVWMVVDVVATYLYFSKGIKFVALEYLVFCFIALFGFTVWVREHRNYSAAKA
jgi:nicotinamide mononucleotide transporter